MSDYSRVDWLKKRDSKALRNERRFRMILNHGQPIVLGRNAAKRKKKLEKKPK